jgi:hypothetical protein
VAVGAVLVIGATSGPSELSNLAGGYGLMLIGAAMYLLAGLKVRERFGRRIRTAISVPSNTGASAG